MVPPASRTFWEHGAREPVMVLGKIEMFLAKKQLFLTSKRTSSVFTSLNFAYYIKPQSKICLKGLYKI